MSTCDPGAIGLASLSQAGLPMNSGIVDPALTAASLNPATSDLPMDFWMYSYKVHMCPVAEPHQWDSCAYAHPGEKARRRHPSKYYAVHCPYSKLKKPCPAGEECPCTHSLFEFWLHPDRFRTSICSRGSKCNRQTCFFAHCEADLRMVPHPPPDPLLAENALNALALRSSNGSGSEELDLPQLDAATLKKIIELCMHQQQAAAAVAGPGGMPADSGSGNTAGLTSGTSAQIVPDIGPQHHHQLQQQQQRMVSQPSTTLPLSGMPGLLRFLPDSEMDSGTNVTMSTSSYSQQEQDPMLYPYWEPDRMPGPPGSIQQQVQQMQLLRQQRQQQQQQQQQIARLAPAQVLGPLPPQQQQQQQVVKPSISACSSPGGRPVMWGEDVKLVPWDGRSPPQQQQQLGGTGTCSSMMSSATATPTNSHLLGVVNASSSAALPTVSAAVPAYVGASSPLLLLSQEPMALDSYQEAMIQQQQQQQHAVPFSGPISSSAGGGYILGTASTCGSGPSHQQQQQQHRPAAMQQLMKNIQLLTGATGTGQLPEGGVSAIGEDLAKLLTPADQKALVMHLLGRLQG